MSRVNIQGITRTYTRAAPPAVDGVDLEVEDGEFLVLLGPSGCGKTTLLRCLAGLELPNEGRIEIGGTVVFDAKRSVAMPPNKRDIGMVFQNYSLWPHMTIEQNVSYPLASRRINQTDQRVRVSEALKLVECQELAGRLPSALSGGQQQRVALARAVIAEPRLMLFDEPLSNLDYRLRSQLREEIREIHRRLGFTALYVTHDQTEALQLGTRVAVMKQGKIEQLATPETVFSKPASTYVADFLGITNRICGSLRSGRWSVGEHSVKVDHMPGEMHDGDYTLYARSSEIVLTTPGSRPTSTVPEMRIPGAKVLDVLYGGERSEWIVEVAGTRMQASAAAHVWSHGVGDTVDVVIRSDAVLHYNSQGLLDLPSPTLASV
jgi:iron(III) transport system ATP-binding protein